MTGAALALDETRFLHRWRPKVRDDRALSVPAQSSPDLHAVPQGAALFRTGPQSSLWADERSRLPGSVRGCTPRTAGGGGIGLVPLLAYGSGRDQGLRARGADHRDASRPGGDDARAAQPAALQLPGGHRRLRRGAWGRGRATAWAAPAARSAASGEPLLSRCRPLCRPDRTLP